MKANELMIGALVRVSEDVCFKKGTIVKIHGIDADNVWAEKGLKGSATCMPVKDPERFTCGVWCNYLEPIPLTPEILEKNRFIQENESWWYKDFRIVLDNSKGESLICGRQVKFTYVHQLQHALRLCGIEKEIEL